MNALTKARLIRLMQVSTNPALLQKPIDTFFDEEEISMETFIDDSLIIQKIISYDQLEVPRKFIYLGEMLKKLIEKGEKIIVWAIFIKNILDLSEYLSSIGIENQTLYGATPVEQDDDNNSESTRESIVK